MIQKIPQQHYLPRRIRHRITRGVAFIAILAVLAMNMPLSTAYALPGLTNARVYMNRQQASIASGQTLEVFFKPTTTLSGSTNHVVLSFPNDAANNGKWCRTTGALTVAGEGEPTTTTQQTAEGGTSMLGSLTAACTQSPDTFTISGVGALLNSVTNNYGVKLSGSTGIIGTGDAGNNIKMTIQTQQVSTPTDQFVIATSLLAADSYTLTANIDATLTVVLSATTVNLGVLDPTKISFQGITSTVSTSAPGYVSLVQYSNVLTSTPDTIADSGTTVTKGTSGFGAATSKSSQTLGTDTSSCTTTLQTSTAGPFNATSLSTTFKQFASAAVNVSGDVTTLCFLASVSGSQAPGSYSTVVTLVTTAKF